MHRASAAALVWITFAAVAPATAQAQETGEDVQVLSQRFQMQEMEAFRHFQKRDFEAAIRAFEQQIAIYADNPRPYYNIACSYALQGDAARAASWLRIAIRRGWRDLDWVIQDGDFAKVRKSKPFADALDFLRELRRATPDAMPRAVSSDSVPLAASTQAIVRASAVQATLVRSRRGLEGADHQRRQLFRVWDRKMAQLTRYLKQNGDAPDADEASRARVETALQYLEEGNAERSVDARLRRTAARYAIALADRYFSVYAGSPESARVRALKAYALSTLPNRDKEAIVALRGVLDDHPRTAAAGASLAALCRVYVRTNRRDHLQVLWKKLPDYGVGEAQARTALPQASLLVNGVPEAIRAAAKSSSGRRTLHLFVVPHDPRSETMLKHARAMTGGKIHVAVFSLDQDPNDGAWVTEHTNGLHVIRNAIAQASALGPVPAPYSILAEADGTVVELRPELPLR